MIARNKRKEKEYVVTQRRVKAWNIAVASAEEAFPMNRAERVMNYAFVYDQSPGAAAETGKG